MLAEANPPERPVESCTFAGRSAFLASVVCYASVKLPDQEDEMGTLKRTDVIELQPGLEVPCRILNGTRKPKAGKDGIERRAKHVDPKTGAVTYSEIGRVEVAKSDIGSIEADGGTGPVAPIEDDAEVEIVHGTIISGEFVEIAEADLDAISEQAKLRVIQVLGTVTRGSIPLHRVTDSHIITPGDVMARSLRMLFGALRTSQRALLVKWAARSKQRLGAIYVDATGVMRLVTLRFEAEVARAAENEGRLAFAEIERTVEGEAQMIAFLKGRAVNTETEMMAAMDDEAAMRASLVAEAAAGHFKAEKVGALNLDADFGPEDIEAVLAEEDEERMAGVDAGLVRHPDSTPAS